jgi:hypothetical protein
MNSSIIAKVHPDLIVIDGFDDCIVGTAERFGSELFAVYDLSKILAKLESQGMTEDEAMDFYCQNQLGSYLGDRTPAFMNLLP